MQSDVKVKAVLGVRDNCADSNDESSVEKKKAPGFVDGENPIDCLRLGCLLARVEVLHQGLEISTVKFVELGVLVELNQSEVVRVD